MYVNNTLLSKASLKDIGLLSPSVYQNGINIWILYYTNKNYSTYYQISIKKLFYLLPSVELKITAYTINLQLQN